MNTRLLYISALVVLGVGITIFLLSRRSSELSKSSPDPQADPTTSAPSPQTSPNTPLPANAETPSNDAKQGVADNEARFRAIFKTPIDVHAKVVDQHDAPVADALITYTLNNDPSGATKSATLKSDATGYFRITGAGAAVYVEITKDGYYRTPPAHENPGSYGRFDFSPLTGSSSPKGTRDTPVLFRLQKKGNAEPLLISKGKMKLPSTGSPTRIAFGEDDAIIATFEKPATTAKRYPWKLTITAVDGKVAERKSPTEFLAPEGVYQNAYSFSVDPEGDGTWKYILDEDLFIAFDSGKYALISFKLFSQKGYLHYQSFLNPSGSPNLEFDPNKVIANP